MAMAGGRRLESSLWNDSLTSVPGSAARSLAGEIEPDRAGLTHFATPKEVIKIGHLAKPLRYLGLHFCVPGSRRADLFRHEVMNEMKIVDFIREELILPDLRSRRKVDVIRELASRLAAVEGVDAVAVERVLLEREKLGSTALAEGIAIPHAKLDSVEDLIGCVGRSRRGVDFGSEDGAPTHLFFVLIAPQGSTGDHLKALARISRLFKDPGFRDRVMSAESASEVFDIINRHDSGS